MREKERSGAICALGRAGACDSVSVECSLLISCDCEDRQRSTEQRGIGQTELSTAGSYLRQHRDRHTLPRAKLVVPLTLAQVPEHRPGRIRGIGRVDGTIRQFGQQPGVDGSTGQLARCDQLASAVDLVEKPGELGSGKVCVGLEPGTHPHFSSVSVIEFGSDRRRSSALPDDRRAERLERFAIPDQRGLALIRKSDCADVFDADLFDRVVSGLELALPEVNRGLFDPTRLGEPRIEVALSSGSDAPALIEDQRTAGRGSLIEGEDQVGSYASSSSSRRRPITTRATAAKTASIAPTPIIRFIAQSVLLATAASSGLWFSAQYHDGLAGEPAAQRSKSANSTKVFRESTHGHRRRSPSPRTCLSASPERSSTPAADASPSHLRPAT